MHNRADLGSGKMGGPIAPAAGGTEVFADMEQWTEVRRRVLVEGMSKCQACQHFRINWKALRKMLTHEEPPGYRRAKPPRRPTVEPVLPVIRQILDDDTKAPKKQRHTGKRIWERLKAEYEFNGGSTVVKDILA